MIDSEDNKELELDANLEDLFVDQENEVYSTFDVTNWKLDIDTPQNKVVPMPKPLSEIKKTLSSFDDFSDLLSTTGILRKNGYQILFRGHAVCSYQLQPTIVWNKIKDYSQEKDILEQLKVICKSFGYERYKLDTFNENLFYLCIGRHLGLYSRLLDWTAGIREALAFLIENKDDYMEHDGCLWLLVYDQNKYHLENDRDPFLINDNRLHVLKEDYSLPDNETTFPLGIVRRFKQHGFFTVQAEKLLDVPFEKMARASDFELYRFIVPKEAKKLLSSGTKLPSLNWLYEVQNAPIVDKIKELNKMFNYKLKE